jgi:site-specific recombinase XerD
LLTNIRTVQAELGYNDVKTTEIYSHDFVGHNLAVMNPLETHGITEAHASDD